MKQQEFDCDGRCLEELLNYSSWFHVSKKSDWFWGLQKLYCKANKLIRCQGKYRTAGMERKKNVKENLLIMPDN